MSRRKPRTVFGIVVVAVLIIGAGWAAAFLVRRPRLTPELRGLEAAQGLGCFGCHGPGGTGGVANPGSEEEEVPSWDGGTAMMYVKNEGEIREWILYGEPRRLQENGEPGHEHEGGESSEHESGERESHLPLHMPAFESIVSDRQLDDLVAYFKAVAAYHEPPDDVRAGYDVAARLGCFGCHGPGGLVGTKNPRSFKGYVPPWRGADYRELVKSEEELRQWILDGHIDRFESNPLAGFFLGRQVIQMPGYEDALEHGELEALMAYIEWLQSE